MSKQKYGKMSKPDFYCAAFIQSHMHLACHQPDDCKRQCDDCVNVIIEHHQNKKS